MVRPCLLGRCTSLRSWTIHITSLTSSCVLRRTAVSCLMDEHNTIMVTWANFHYQDFVMNWVDHVRNVGVTAYLVGAMDDKLLEVVPSTQLCFDSVIPCVLISYSELAHTFATQPLGSSRASH